MAGAKEPKQYTGRRAYLNDFHLNDKGEYVFMGRMMSFDEEHMTYRQYIVRSVLSAVIMIAATALAECLPAVGLSRFGFTAIPWALQMVMTALTAYAVWKTAFGKNPMREYVYKSSAEKLPGRVILAAAFSLLTVIADTVYILIKGWEGEVLYTALRPVLSLVCGVTAFLFSRMLKKTAWKA